MKRVKMRMLFVTLVCCWAGSEAVTRTCIAAEVSSSTTMKDIRAAWQARSARTRSLSFEWSQKTTLGKGSYPSALLSPEKSKGVYPPRAVRRVVPVASFRLQGPQVIYERELISASAWLEGKSGRTFLSGFDGKESRAYKPPGDGYPEGTVYARDSYMDMETLAIKPVLFAFRAIEPDLLNLELDRFRVASQQAVVDGRTCIVVEDRSRSPERTLWLDPSREFVPLRYFESTRGQPPNVQLTISYQQDQEHGWIPINWSGAFLGKSGQIMEAVEVNVAKYEINRELRSEELRVTFPPGTWVRNQKTDEQYIVLDGGGRRIITPGELARNPSYEEILATRSGMAGLSLLQRLLRHAFFWTNVVLALGIVSFLVWRLWKRRRSV